MTSLDVYPAGRIGNLLFFSAAAALFASKLNIAEGDIAWHGHKRDLKSIQELIPFYPTLNESVVSESLQILIRNFFGTKGNLPVRSLQKIDSLRKRFGKKILSLESISFELDCQDKYAIFDYFQTFEVVSHVSENWKRYAEVRYAERLPKDLLNLISRSDAFVVHLRFGDYLDSNHKVVYGELSSDFYSRALSSLGASSSSTVLITTDSPTEAREKLLRSGFDNLITVSERWGTSPVEDFMTLVLSQQKVLSNSTFSWWAGYLSGDPTKICAPSPLSKSGGRQCAWDPRWLTVPAHWAA
jgi:hypothetical protein